MCASIFEDCQITVYIGTLQIYNVLYMFFACVYILSVYSPFSDRVGLTLHNIPSPVYVHNYKEAYCTCIYVVISI